MKRSEDLPITKHTLNLYKGDFERLQAIAGRLGAGKVIRDLVRAYLNSMEQRLPELDLDLATDEAH